MDHREGLDPVFVEVHSFARRRLADLHRKAEPIRAQVYRLPQE
jgi:hypothetical protein